MKVTLDLTRLLYDGAITQAEHDRLARLGKRETGQVLVNVLVGFGVVAVSAGALLLMPSAITGVVLGAVLMMVGMGLIWGGQHRWSLFATICVLVAALLLGAGIMLFSQGAWSIDDTTNHPAVMSLTAALLLVVLLFAASAALARSALLAAAAVLALSGALGSGTGYWHASYGLSITEPFATVVLFSALALVAYLGSRRVGGDWERLAIIVARTAVFLVNLGFWIGSLWGDDLTWLNHPPGTAIPAMAFAIAWAVALFVVAVWSARVNRRWVLNVAAVFGGIHFYTQWFEHLGASPASVLVAGVLVLVFAVTLWWVNQRVSEPGV